MPIVLIGKRKKYTDVVAQNSILPSLLELGQVISTFILATFGWIIFRANSISEFVNYVTNIGNNIGIHDEIEGKKALSFIAILLLVEWVNRRREHAFAFHIQRQWLRWSVYLIVALLCLTQAGKQVQFIYFQF